jgi:hypothetical protein
MAISGGGHHVEGSRFVLLEAEMVVGGAAIGSFSKYSRPLQIVFGLT